MLRRRHCWHQLSAGQHAGGSAGVVALSIDGVHPLAQAAVRRQSQRDPSYPDGRRREMDDALSSLARWEATVIYRHDSGPVDVPMLLRELKDLQDRLECAPHWDTIEKIEIRRVNHIDSPTLTVEQQKKM